MTSKINKNEWEALKTKVALNLQNNGIYQITI